MDRYRHIGIMAKVSCMARSIWSARAINGGGPISSQVGIVWPIVCHLHTQLWCKTPICGNRYAITDCTILVSCLRVSFPVQVLYRWICKNSLCSQVKEFWKPCLTCCGPLYAVMSLLVQMYLFCQNCFYQGHFPA